MSEVLLRNFKYLLLWMFVSGLASPGAADSLSVTYIANDGFLISCQDKNILIDALFDKGFGKYATPSESLQARIINGEPPFESIDLYLVTHNHGDHFTPQMVNAFMTHHNETLLVSSPQVCDQLDRSTIPGDRIKVVDLDIGASTEMKLKGIGFKIYRFKHLEDSSGVRCINLGFLMDVCGTRIFHPGDITLEWSKDQLKNFKMEKENIDILFQPFFDLSGFSVDLVSKWGPVYIIADHVPTAQFKEAVKNFRNAFPGGILMEHEMDRINIGTRD